MLSPALGGSPGSGAAFPQGAEPPQGHGPRTWQQSPSLIPRALCQSCQHSSHPSQMPGLPPGRQHLCPGASARPRDGQSWKGSEKWKRCSRSSQLPLTSPFSPLLHGAASSQQFSSSGANDLCVQSKPSAASGDALEHLSPEECIPKTSQLVQLRLLTLKSDILDWIDRD